MVMAAVLAGAWSCSAPAPQIEPPKPVDEHVAPVVATDRRIGSGRLLSLGG